MSIRGCLAVLVALGAAYALGAQGRNDPKMEPSPHTAALELVFKTQQARLREVDTENWWHDAKERAWVVRRPFHPGVIDSTHLFDVSYRIGGKEVASWMVDTRKGTVQTRDAKVKKL